MIYSYNKSKQAALLLNFVLVKNSTCFNITSMTNTYCCEYSINTPYDEH